MKSIDLIEDISFPAQRDRLVKSSSAYKAALDNDIDTDIIEGKQPDENSGVVKFEPIDPTEQNDSGSTTFIQFDDKIGNLTNTGNFQI